MQNARAVIALRSAQSRSLHQIPIELCLFASRLGQFSQTLIILVTFTRSKPLAQTSKSPSVMVVLEAVQLVAKEEVEAVLS